jgi:hypothetical protein
MADEEKKTRQEVIDDAIAAADGSNQERDSKEAQGIKGVKASDNPKKPGSALYRAWERKRQAGELQAQK